MFKRQAKRLAEIEEQGAADFFFGKLVLSKNKIFSTATVDHHGTLHLEALQRELFFSQNRSLSWPIGSAFSSNERRQKSHYAIDTASRESTSRIEHHGIRSFTTEQNTSWTRRPRHIHKQDRRVAPCTEPARKLACNAFMEPTGGQFTRNAFSVEKEERLHI